MVGQLSTSWRFPVLACWRLVVACGWLLVVLIGATALPARAAHAPAPTFEVRAVDEAWRAALPMAPEAATRAYLDRLSPQARARSDAYFEGGYWLILWNALLGLGMAALLLWTRPSAAVRDWARRVARWRWLADALYGAFYGVATWVLSLPLTIYEGFVREHAYGMATQDFGAWFVERLVSLAVMTLVLAFAVSLLYAVLRRAGAAWWMWATGVTLGLMTLGVMVAPVWIDPLFNTYKPVEDGPIKRAVLAMAHANGVPADNVYEFDASRQTTRVSANVSGIGSTASVRLNDNLLRRSSDAEIRAVMGHEIGHYAMNHITKSLVQMGVLILLGFALAAWAMRRLLDRFGPRWQIAPGPQGVADVGSLPLLVGLIGLYMFVATPVTNTIVRTMEAEADMWSLNLAREPLGLAETMLKLAEYRKTEPGPIEEMVFFDHPSARSRILMAMRWREQQLP
ncbi:M48 family metallopeptidase [Ideonella sp. DXS29W]|uniref:M48 family metallopeptidase n=1 Tax=Ideonella lacteola TaxID=2984193 RepID=A0ABU9BRI5_9BURK